MIRYACTGRSIAWHPLALALALCMRKRCRTNSQNLTSFGCTIILRSIAMANRVPTGIDGEQQAGHGHGHGYHYTEEETIQGLGSIEVEACRFVSS
jgi:hypothetical protein